MGIKQELERFAGQVGFTLAYLDETTSTNDVARDPRYDAGAVVIAERQSRGRGQRGNSWSSSAGANLTFSVVLCPGFLEAAQQFYLSKAVSLAVCDTVESFGVRPQVKWPNDIYIDGRKVAGILIENDLAGNFLSRSWESGSTPPKPNSIRPCRIRHRSQSPRAGSWTGRKFLDYFTKK